MVTTIMNNGGKSRTCVFKDGPEGENWYFEDTGERFDSLGETRLNLESEIEALKVLRANVANDSSLDKFKHFDDFPRRMSLAITHLQEAEFWLESVGALR